MNKIDHFVYFHPKLEEGIQYINKLTGIEATAGGQHLGRGTWNAIFSLGESCYFEIISPDPRQIPFHNARWMGIDYIEVPQLIRWAVSVNNLKALLLKAQTMGMAVGEVQEGSRKLQNGEALKWQLTAPSMVAAVEPLPFLIEWATEVHPSQGKKVAATLDKLTLSHPNPSSLHQQLAWLELNVEIVEAEKPAISVELNTPLGNVRIE